MSKDIIIQDITELSAKAKQMGEHHVGEVLDFLRSATIVGDDKEIATHLREFVRDVLIPRVTVKIEDKWPKN